MKRDFLDLRDKQDVAQILLEHQAVVLRPDNPFNWATGWKSPIYCDNRVLLSYPEARKKIIQYFLSALDTAKQKGFHVQGFAGVLSAGVPWAAILSHQTDLPLVYIRPEPKAHGKKNQVEGSIEPDSDYVVIEDLVSTGKSSVAAKQAGQAEGMHSELVGAIFTYGFEKAEKAFMEANLSYFTLTDYETLIGQAKGFSSAQLDILADWRKDPSKWSVERGGGT